MPRKTPKPVPAREGKVLISQVIFGDLRVYLCPMKSGAVDWVDGMYGRKYAKRFDSKAEAESFLHSVDPAAKCEFLEV